MNANLTLQQRAPVFRIAHLVSLYNVCQVKRDAYTMRGGTYILLSCALFLRKSGAAALLINEMCLLIMLLGDPAGRWFTKVSVRSNTTFEDRSGRTRYVLQSQYHLRISY